ncbi:MAG: NAD(P)H-binding protein [bacterium]|nr:NAD(P)H-binding protein [bacterium]MDE0501527.1 NAD(P)H-binding protein [bacterium]
MPVMVVGADTPVGEAIIGELIDPDREVRAFVSDPSVGVRLKEAGVKVAMGDVSDASHVSAACLRCHTVVLVCDAGRDGREISFAADAGEVHTQWAQAVSEAGAKRVIWVANHPVPEARVAEQATVESDLSHGEIANRVADLDDAAVL